MVQQASDLGMGIGRFSRLLRKVGVLAMLNVKQDTTQQVATDCQVPPAAGVQRLLVPGEEGWSNH